ncbi:MAG TPA: hypothetical protein VEC02_08090 [Nitrososphaerales archaeon]|nr:hypothetical protein [Nitrososphaerales archaeon]
MKIALGTLKEKGDDLVAFLEPRVGVKPSISGDSVDIEDEGMRKGVKPRHVKTYIKRFLFMNGVRGKYRVFVQGKELTVQEIEVGEEEKPKEKEAPKAEAAPEPAKEEPKEEPPKKAAKKARSKKKAESED